jgi:hypothetical protein
MQETAVQVSKVELCWALWKFRRKYQEIGLLVLPEETCQEGEPTAGV